MSTSVANAFAHFGDPETSETEHFIRQFDRFFDCLNVRSPTEGYQKRKESLKPYTSSDDARLVVCCSVELLHVMYACIYMNVSISRWNLYHVAFSPQWLEKGFLMYLADWEREVKNSGKPVKEQRKMLLSGETITGLQITGT